MNETAARTTLTERILTSSKQDASLLELRKRRADLDHDRASCDRDSIPWPSIAGYGILLARARSLVLEPDYAGPKSVGRQNVADAGGMRAVTREVNISAN